MNLPRRLCFIGGVLMLISSVVSTPLHGADYGHFAGQVVVEGTPGLRKLKVSKDDPKIRDLCCRQQDIPDQKLVINPKNKGLANCFVYLKKCDLSTIHPDLKVSRVTEVMQLQRGCTFVPHCLIVRTDQQVVIKSDDPVPHNLNYKARYNVGYGGLVDPRGPTRLPRFTACERYPTGVECNMHTCISDQWLIIDHPYATITDQDGRFEIKNLPAGRHEFIIHHQLAGMVHYPEQKTIEVEILNGRIAELGVLKVAAAKFE